MTDAIEALAERFPQLSRLLDRQLQITPEQRPFHLKRFSKLLPLEGGIVEDLAKKITMLAGDNIDQYCSDYAFICSEQLREELHFRRHGTYSCPSFEDAVARVYSNREYMTRYMNGLLMSDLWWSNHTKVLAVYRDEFIAKSPVGHRFLEVGPGHGLFIGYAAERGQASTIEGWDVSQASIGMTQHSLAKLGVDSGAELRLQDLFEVSTEDRYSSIVFSEILEHMDRPERALKALKAVLAEDGRLFVNMPINSPAIDHLFNLPDTEAFRKFVTDAGFVIEADWFFPATNQSLEMCAAKKLTISCVAILRHA